MKLKSLHLRRIPGLADPFKLTDLNPSMTVIVGPNGIGKTSICRAVNALLWPEKWAAADGYCEVDAEWTDVEWVAPGNWAAAERVGGKTIWRGALGLLDSPALPDSHLASCFTMRIDEMLADQKPGSDLASIIAREMAGGYDLGKARAADRLKIGHPKGPGDRLKAANRKISILEKSQEKLRDDERLLPALGRRRQAALDYQKQLLHLQNAASLAQARVEWDNARRGKSALPESLSKIQPGDDAILTALEGALANSQEQERKSGEAVARADAEIERCALPSNTPIPAATLADWDSRPGQLQQKQSECKQASAAVAAHRTTRDSAARCLAPGLDPRACAKIPQSDIQRAQKLLHESMRHSAEQTALESKIALTTLLPMPPKPTKMEEAARLLAEFLALPKAGEQNRTIGGYLTALIALAALTIAVGIATGVLHQPLGWLAAALGLAGVVAALFAHRAEAAGREEQRTDAQREEIKQKFAACGVAKPDAWERAAVYACCAEISEQIATAAAEINLAKERKTQRESLESLRPGLEQGRENLEAERRSLQASTGLDLAWPEIGNIALLRNIVAFQEAEAKLLDAERMSDSLSETCRDCLARLNAQLAQHSVAPEFAATDSTSAKAIVDDLKDRSSRLGQALSYRESERQSAEKAGGEIAASSDKIQAFLDKRSIISAAEFRALFADWPRFNALCKREEALAALIKGWEESLATAPELAGLSLADVEARQEAAKSKSQELDDITKEIAEINANVKKAKTENSLSNALADKEAALADIAAEREKAFFAVGGQFLLEQAQTADAASQPAILQSASKLLTQVTAGAYSLQVRPGASAFQAFDHIASSLRAFSELSGGTRLQLLLCAKIAFAEHIAGGKRLPLFLDEAFKHSDPMRTAELIGCLKTLVADGRQIIYLTSDPADELHFKKAFADNPASLACIDLAKVRGIADTWRGPIASLATEAIPLPHPDEAPDDYRRRILVPRFAAHRPLESQHLFYLLMDNLPCLHKCLGGGVTAIGQWRTLRDPRPSRLISEAESREIEAWREVARIFLAEWQRGRGKPVSPDDLAAADLGATFLPRAQELCAQANGDPQLLLNLAAEPKAKIFKPAQAKLAEFLTDRGYLPTGPIQTLDQIRLAAQNLSDAYLLAPEQIAERIDALHGYAQAG